MMRKRLSMLAVVVVAVAAWSAAPPSGASGAAQTRQTMSFDLGWSPAHAMPWTHLTQAILFTLRTSPTSKLDMSNLQAVNVRRWVAAAHAHHVKALISIGGSDDQNWQNACAPANRQAFVANIIAYAVGHGFDGIDIDVEDSLWAAQSPTSPAQTACVSAIADAAHAARSRAHAKLWVSEDVVTNWQGPWIAPYARKIDQFNLMTYGDSLATLAADVRATRAQGLPYAKMLVGVDVDDYAEPSGGCQAFADFARSHNLAGAFVWDAVSDEQKSRSACAAALAGH